MLNNKVSSTTITYCVRTIQLRRMDALLHFTAIFTKGSFLFACLTKNGLVLYSIIIGKNLLQYSCGSQFFPLELNPTSHFYKGKLPVCLPYKERSSLIFHNNMKNLLQYSCGSQFFPLELNPTQKGSKNENIRADSP